MKSKLLKGSNLGLIKTSPIIPGHYPLYNLVGLRAGHVQCLLNALMDIKNPSALALDILEVIPSIKLF